MHNTLTLIGSLASEVLLSDAHDGSPTAMFKLLVPNRRLDRSTGTWVSGPPTCMTVTCNRRLALNVAACLHRGDPAIVTGRLRVQQASDSRLSRVEIEAVAVGPDLNRVVAAPARAVA